MRMWEKWKLSIHLGYCSCLENCLAAFKYETELPEDPALLLLDAHPGEMEISPLIKHCTIQQMLFTVAKNRKSKQPIDVSTQNGAYPLMEYCLAIKGMKF